MEPFWRPNQPAKLIIGNALYVALVFAAAGDPLWPQAWALLAAQALIFRAGGRAVMRVNAPLAEEREAGLGHANVERFDRAMMPVVVGLLPLTFWAAGLQRRLAPASFAVPLGWQLAAAPAVVLALLLQVWALVENRFFSSVVRLQSDRGHAVCSTGPYAFVRHPGYTGMALQALAEAALLQSTWANYLIVARLVALVARTALEDRFLKRALPGYEAYARRVRWRLVPGVW